MANNFFDPGSTYGGTAGWDTTPLVKDYLDPQIPQGVYTGFLANQGLGGFDRQSQWARGLYGQTQSGYQAALRQNPALTYNDYLRQQFGGSGGGFGDMWAGLAPEQRGENVNRWLPNTRLISWG